MFWRTLPRLLAAFVLACAGAACTRPRPQSSTGLDASCRERPPAASHAFTFAALDSLIGTFDLTLVTRTPPRGRTVSGRLELWRQDSSRVWKFALGSVPESVRRQHPERGRYLAGAFDIQPPDSSAWWTRMRSRDPARPGVTWTDGHLRMGDVDVPDGTGDDLTVEWLTDEGFGGHWYSDLGIGRLMDASGRFLPNPAGFFCARRVAA
jgi:hypothetical protein